MSDHLVLSVDHLIKPASLQSVQAAEVTGSSGECSSAHTADEPTCVIDVEGMRDHAVSEEEEPLIQTVECRICQEEDGIENLEIPCACSGSLKVLIFIMPFIIEIIMLEYQGTLFVISAFIF